MQRQRRFHVLMAAAALAAGVAQVLLGSGELALTFAPLLLIAGLLLSGRYLGEERILARRTRLVTPALFFPRPDLLWSSPRASRWLAVRTVP